MKKPVNNLSDVAVKLGSVEIGAKTQRTIRESLITEDEKKAVIEEGLIIEFNPQLITVRKAKNDEDTGSTSGNTGNTGAQDTTLGNPPKEVTVSHVAYPVTCINKKGDVTGHPGMKAQVEALIEKYGENLLSDNDFQTTYPEADIEAHRVEEINLDEQNN